MNSSPAFCVLHRVGIRPPIGRKEFFGADEERRALGFAGERRFWFDQVWACWETLEHACGVSAGGELVFQDGSLRFVAKDLST